MRHVRFRSHPDERRRGGTTLTEVLMSIMLMGIGVVTVASLFPIAILRSAKATQLTQATILRMNAEALIEIMPQLVRNPNGLSNQQLHLYYSQHYIVDPFGWTGTTATFRNWFGNDGTAALTNTVPRRFNGAPQLFNWNNNGLSSAQCVERAARFVTLPDTWTVQVDGIPVDVTNDLTTTPTTTTVTLPSNVDLTNIAVGSTSDPPPAASPGQAVSRIILFDNTGRRSETRTITGINVTAGTVTASPALSPDIGPANVERIRIETQSRRYTWLMTVRMNESGIPTIDLVVFFNRTVEEPERDEQVYGLQPQASAAQAQGFRYTVVIPAGAQRPYLKRGGFIFDVDNARWHRILKVENELSASPLVTLDLPAQSQGVRRGMFLRGIVDVFPLGTKDVLQ